ncbi:RNI-like protein [Mycena kentingensis (nom. inval.)]|nr:RNI-like protein [Mycena kentingensis (nom. inval.)]
MSRIGCIDLLDAGLSGVAGAQHIIGLISSRRRVTKLILGSNDLGDAGSVVLFRFLSSAIGRKYQVEIISLNANHIGNRGLSAISEYLAGSYSLKQLFLQNNQFSNDPSLFAKFAKAVNSSHLELLALTSNWSLADSFMDVFIRQLEAPHLLELHLSAIGLTATSGPLLVEFISSSSCNLHTLKCSGNSLGLRAVRALVRAVERSNFALTSLELYSNSSAANPPASSDNTEDDEDEECWNPGSDAWKANDAYIRRVLARNSHLKRVIEKDALCLLRCARPLLLTRSAAPAGSPQCEDCSCATSSRTPVETISPTSGRGTFPFLFLPTELQLDILALLAPSLSSAQRVRIYDYAASPSTLPPARTALCVPGFQVKGASLCVLDPATTMAFGVGGGGCSGGKCAGGGGKSVLCHKEQQRAEWLKAVGCATYDPNRGDWTGF